MRTYAELRTDAPSVFNDEGAVRRLLNGTEQHPAWNINHLRVNAMLQHREWEMFDEAVLAERVRRRGAFAFFEGRSELRFPLENALGHLVLTSNRRSDKGPARRGMDPTVPADRDRLDFSLDTLPIYCTYSDFGLDIRTLSASRNMGQPLDTQEAAVSTRVVLESLDDALINGSGITSGGGTAYGLLNHPNRNTYQFAQSAGAGNPRSWNSVKTGEEILVDVNAMRTAAKADRMFGDYVLLHGSDYETKLDSDYKASVSGTIRARILELRDIVAIEVDDFLPADTAILVQLSSDVIQIVDGEEPTLVTWSPSWGEDAFKVLAIQVARVRADYSNRSGIVHGSIT